MQAEAATNEIAVDTAADILKSVSIPACPAVASALMDEVRRDECDFARINRLISGDVSLAAAMMKTANSPFFSLRTKVRTVHEAISVLGLKNIISIVTGLSLRQALSTPGISMDRFWDRSNYHAAVSARLARRTRRISVDDAYTFGLFHDCGIPIMMQRFPTYKDTLALANNSREPVLGIENQHHKTDHAVVGAMLARNWQLPDVVVEAVRLHHDLQNLHGAGIHTAHSSPVLSLVAISLMADHYIARFLGAADEAAWIIHGEAAIEFLQLSQDAFDDLQDEVIEELGELRASRG